MANPVYDVRIDSKEHGLILAAVDPIMGLKSDFEKCVNYVEKSLFTGLPQQREVPLKDPRIGPKVRLLSLFHIGAPLQESNCFVSYNKIARYLVPRRETIKKFLASEAISADIVIAVSGYEDQVLPSPNRSTAFAATDDMDSAAASFSLDGKVYKHFSRSIIPGTIALAYKAGSLTTPHEFMHAMGSFQNLQIADLYTPPFAGAESINQKSGTPPPPIFAKYRDNPFGTDQDIPLAGNGYHCERSKTDRVSMMDNFFSGFNNGKIPGGIDCENDKITRKFVTDRILHKLNR